MQMERDERRKRVEKEEGRAVSVCVWVWVCVKEREKYSDFRRGVGSLAGALQHDIMGCSCKTVGLWGWARLAWGKGEESLRATLCAFVCVAVCVCVLPTTR